MLCYTVLRAECQILAFIIPLLVGTLPRLRLFKGAVGLSCVEQWAQGSSAGLPLAYSSTLLLKQGCHPYNLLRTLCVKLGV